MEMIDGAIMIDHLETLAQPLRKSGYGQYIQRLVDTARR